MAHTRTTDKDARLIAQCSSGKFLRNVNSVTFSVGAARTNNTAPNLIMADAIQNEAAVKGIFVAPCAAKILSIYANGSPYVDLAGTGTTYVMVTKGVSGAGDTNILTGSGVQVGEATLGTACTTDVANDGTLSTTAGVTDLAVGDHVFATLTVSNDAVQTAVGYVTCTVEWEPTDAGWPRS